MWRWPRITPGSVSTSTSCNDARWTWANRRTWACAKAMSSRSLGATWLIAAEISAGDRKNSFGVQPSNFCDRSLTAASPRADTSARICSTVALTCRSFSSRAAASLLVLRRRIVPPGGFCTRVQHPTEGVQFCNRTSRASWPHMQLQPIRLAQSQTDLVRLGLQCVSECPGRRGRFTLSWRGSPPVGNR